jgi:UDP-2,3-diacylglucosamine hydrolase
VHLGVASTDSERRLLRHLRELPESARSLVIMGDLFDFWFAWEYAMPRTGFRVLAALADLRDTGVPVLWIGGNHDCWGGEALEKETGATYTLAPWRGPIGAWDALLAHGDGLREKEDAPYRRLRTVLRHPWSIAAYSWLHPDFATRVAMRSSKTSRKGRARDGGSGLLAVGTAALSAPDGPRLVLHGHSHVPMLRTAGRGVYANAGAWYLDHQFLVIEDDAISRCERSTSHRTEIIESVERPR